MQAPGNTLITEQASAREQHLKSLLGHVKRMGAQLGKRACCQTAHEIAHLVVLGIPALHSTLPLDGLAEKGHRLLTLHS